MTPAQALRAIRGYAASNRIEFSTHAKRRMEERGVTPRHVQYALENAPVCIWQPGARTWKVAGRDLHGDTLTVVLVVDDGGVVVTVF